jgi:hypothetical protein
VPGKDSEHVSWPTQVFPTFFQRLTAVDLASLRQDRRGAARDTRAAFVARRLDESDVDQQPCSKGNRAPKVVGQEWSAKSGRPRRRGRVGPGGRCRCRRRLPVPEKLPLLRGHFDNGTRSRQVHSDGRRLSRDRDNCHVTAAGSARTTVSAHLSRSHNSRGALVAILRRAGAKPRNRSRWKAGPRRRAKPAASGRNQPSQRGQMGRPDPGGGPSRRAGSSQRAAGVAG